MHLTEKEVSSTKSQHLHGNKQGMDWRIGHSTEADVLKPARRWTGRRRWRVAVSSQNAALCQPFAGDSWQRPLDGRHEMAAQCTPMPMQNRGTQRTSIRRMQRQHRLCQLRRQSGILQRITSLIREADETAHPRRAEARAAASTPSLQGCTAADAEAPLPQERATLAVKAIAEEEVLSQQRGAALGAKAISEKK